MSLLVIVGYGPGISHATAEEFGRRGFTVALLARSAERLAAGVERLAASGVDAHSYQVDASDPESIRAVIAAIRDELGAVTSVLWTASRNGDVKDVLQTRPENVERVFDVGVRGLLTCVQELVEDLKASTSASVLVANGALGEASSQADALAKHLNYDAVALENAAKTKLVGILAERLRDFDIYVGEVTIVGAIAGTPTAGPTAISPALVAETFWTMTQERTTTRVRLSS